ncbi:MAG TPA: methionyl-tRNA formyltransferase [Tepidiformaceae bacterium]|nr:methionyl-tRNA formyltransferase [Tepidiformaceae bacterium]
MGSPEFAVASLHGLAAGRCHVAAVVTQPDKPAGRGSRLQPPPVKLAAQELGVPVIQPATLRDPAAQASLAAFSPDLLVVAAYGQILPQAVLDLAPRGAINVHASLLPRWRGASPISAAILAGDEETGVTIMQLVRKMDAGPVIEQSATKIADGETAGELEARLAQLGAATLVDTLPAFLAREIEPVPQDEARVTYCGLIKKDDGRLRAAYSVVEAERVVRAYNPWPGASVQYRDARLAIWLAHIVDLEDDAGPEPGSLSVHDGEPAVAFDGGLLVLDEVQRSGSRRVTGRDFLNGERGALPPAVGLL